jgi:fibronectin-binding autotransporter adhesin
MAQNYTRQSSFADGDTITAALFNNEFNQVVNAFAYSASSDSSTGHKHDGTSGQGGNIPQIGDIDFLNKIVVDNTNNRWGFYVQVSSGTVEQLRIQDGAIVPVTDDDIDLGTSSLEFKDLFLDGTAHIDTLDVDVNATVAGTLGVTGATTLSSTLGVTGATTLSSTLGVTGATTLSSTLGVTGATTLSSTLGVTGATTLSSTLGVTGAITGSSTLQATTITATTAFVPDASDGASLGTVSLEFSDLFLADGALIAFGNDQDVTITHLADAGLLLNGARGLFFNDTTQYINAPNGTTLDIAATDEIELNATLIDINGAVDISGNLDVGGNLVVTGTTTFNGGTLTMGDAATDNVVFGADINSNIIPNTDDTYDLGSSSQEWRNLYIDGTANIDSLVADTADINGGTIDGATIATSDITVGSGKTLNVSAGTLTLADNQISGDKVEGGTIAATTITTLTSTTGNITSVNATTVDTTNLEVTTLKAKDGTAAGSIADSTGVVTLASSVLTTTDINGGTVDGVTIGGSSAGDITYANLSDGTITITAFADEDDMSSDSATLVPTQQSVKAYVDSQVGTVDTLSEILANGNTTGSTDIAVDSAQKVQFRDAAIYLNSSVDGQLDIVADTEIQIAATTVDLNGNLDVSGTALVAGVLTTTAATVFNGGFASNADSTLGTDKKVQFRDAAIYINSSVDGQLDIVADTEIQIAATTIDINGAINASGEIIAASLDISGDIDVDGTANLDVVDIDGAVDMATTLTVAGNVDFNGDLDVDGTTNLDVVDIDGAVNMATTALVTGVLTTTAATVFNGGFASNADSTLGTDKKVQFRDSAIYINSSADGQLDIVADTEIQIAATTVDLNGNLDVSGTTVSAGKITADAGIDIDNINIDGTTIALSSGDLTLDVAGNIRLDADDNGEIRYLDGGTQYAAIKKDGNNALFQSIVADGDFIIQGIDGASFVSALTLDMSAAGVATFNSNVILPDNGYFLFGDTTSGIQGNSSSDFIKFYTANTERFRIASNGDISFYEDTGTTPKFFWDSSAESLGIGASTVESTLHLQASNAGGRGATLTIDNNAASTLNNESQITFLTDAGASVAGTANARIKAISTDAGNGATALTFTTWSGSAEGEALRIDSSRNLYCSGGSGGTILTLTASSGTTTGDIGRIRFGNNDIDSNLANIVGYQNGATDSGGLKFETQPTGGATTERMRIDSSGNVGISNSIPSSFNGGANNLVVGSGSGSEGMTIYGGAESNIFFADGTAGTAAYIGRIEYSHSSDLMRFYVNNLNAMTIDANKDVGIGLSNGNHRLQVLNDKANFAVAVFTSTSAATTEYGISLALTNDPNDASRYFLEGAGGGTARFRIYSNGNMVNQNNSYGSISDEKLKENIVDAGSQWDDIKALRVRKYSFKKENASSATQIGVIAQEVEAAGMAGLVYESPDQVTAEDGTIEDTGEVTKTVKYSILYMKSVKALQEAMERIESLEARIAALES